MRQISSYPLWLGHCGDVRDLRQLFAAEITALVDLAINEAPATVPREFVYCRFPLHDGAGNPPWLLRAAVETIASLLASRTPTLVYCSAGMSRTPAIAAASIALMTGRPPEDCLLELAESGARDVNPALWRDVCEVLRLKT